MILKLQEQHSVPLAKNQQQALQVALQLIWKAWQYAVDARVDPWQFAVEINELQQAGVNKGELRWLIANRYAIPAIEVTLPAHTKRQFKSIKNALFPENTCFVLSEIGAVKLNAQSDGRSSAPQASIKIMHKSIKLPVKATERHPAEFLPRWDKSLKVLKVGPQTVKQFRTPSPIQELIITAFQEAGWPSRIDDPLPLNPAQDSKRRLNNAIRCLNRNQIHKLIQFRGDGSGTGIVWENRTLNNP